MSEATKAKMIEAIQAEIARIEQIPTDAELLAHGAWVIFTPTQRDLDDVHLSGLRVDGERWRLVCQVYLGARNFCVCWRFERYSEADLVCLLTRLRNVRDGEWWTRKGKSESEKLKQGISDGKL